jgi:hypothetical protein
LIVFGIFVFLQVFHLLWLAGCFSLYDPKDE